MFTKGENSFEIRLRNADGIPVLQLCGTVTKAALKSLRSNLDRLSRAGHYHIVINIERANASNWRLLSSLAGTIRDIHAHYGSVDLVAGRDLAAQLAALGGKANLFRLFETESQAISRIKGLPRQPDTVSNVNARFMEQS
ncbi:MAG: hypothetical protein A2Z18_04235 [Armatimonadetes bacterium RBG_16_58_9]|nr:MAG: hypothetical protein A2Z18_04235 [Armatimonadetes bacterium RBG_16_58_9]